MPKSNNKDKTHEKDGKNKSIFSKIFLVPALITALIGVLLVYISLHSLNNIPNLAYLSYIILICAIFWILLEYYFRSASLKIPMSKYRILAIIFIISTFLTYYLSITIGGFVIAPDLMGKSQDESISILKDYNLKTDIHYKYVENKSLLGLVINQDPTNDTLISKNTPFSLVIGKNIVINILEPTTNSIVDHIIKVKGDVTGITNENIYILVQPQPKKGEDDGPYEWYMQPEVIRSDGNWEANAYIGLDKETNRSFLIAAIITRDKLNYNEIYGFNLPTYGAIDMITVWR